MADQGVPQIEAARPVATKRPTGRREIAQLSNIFRIVKEFLRRIKDWWHPRVILLTDGRPIGRTRRAREFVGALHDLAGLDAAARTQVPQQVYDDFIASFEHCRDQTGRDRNTLKDSETWRRLLACAPEHRAELAVHAYARFRVITNCPSYSSFDWQAGYAANEIFTTLMRSNLPFSQAQLERLAALMVDPRDGCNPTGDAPESAILRALERKKLAEELDPEIARHLLGVIARRKIQSEQYPLYEYNKDWRAFGQRLDALLNLRGQSFALPPSPWSARVQNEIAREPAERQTRLSAILELASTGRGAQPTRAWLKQAEAIRHGGDDLAVAAMLCAWVKMLWPAGPVGPLGADQAPPDQAPIDWSTIVIHEELGRRLLWMAGLLGCDAAVLEAERYSGSRILLSGAITALSMLETKGVPALLSLRRKVKGAERAMVDKAMTAIAERQGVPVSTLEETTVADHGLDGSGTVELPAGAGVARISLDGTSATLAWISASGIPKKGPPKPANDAERQQIAVAKARAKAISDTLKGQAARLEELYLADHLWPIDVWRKTYVEHPVLAHLARRLIWSFTSRGDRQLGILDGDRPSGVDGRPLDVSTDAEVRLWHPFFSVTEVVLAWRRRIGQREITQPFKQAWREIYVLTDAERSTDTYSNRFASHVLHQSQFRALGHARGWKVPALGNWDGPDSYPERIIPRADLVAEFAVGPVAGDPAPNGLQTLIVTDRVHFFSSRGESVPLDQVPPLVLSEIFRDLDLFTSVASIGTDPAWTDGGREGPFADYWRRAAASELQGSARTRREVLTELLPMLSIADQCSLDDRHLIVRGKLQAYCIHLGSGNIIMTSNNRYLCIVPANGGGNSRVRLPFEGDRLLSVILSKAFMLAADDKISDPAIISQMKG